VAEHERGGGRDEKRGSERWAKGNFPLLRTLCWFQAHLERKDQEHQGDMAQVHDEHEPCYHGHC
jgi:hypothetical protein